MAGDDLVEVLDAQPQVVAARPTAQRLAPSPDDPAKGLRVVPMIRCDVGVRLAPTMSGGRLVASTDPRLEEAVLLNGPASTGARAQ
jgi:hypothetical protein